MRDVAGLGFSLYNWWQRELAKFRKDRFQLERDGPIVYLNFDREILMGFENEKRKNRESINFYVHSTDLLDDSYRAKVADLLNRRLNGSTEPEDKWPFDRTEAMAYKKIFGKNLPHLIRRTIPFKRGKITTDYDGLSIITPVISLVGKEGGLSDNVFIYGRKGLLVPVYAVLEER